MSMNGLRVYIGSEGTLNRSTLYNNVLRVRALRGKGFLLNAHGTLHIRIAVRKSL